MIGISLRNGYEKRNQKSRNIGLLNFDFGTFLGLVLFLQCRELLPLFRIVFV